MKEKLSPNRSSYPKEEVTVPEAIAAFALHSINQKAGVQSEHSNPVNNVWSTIGFWRNLPKVSVHYEKADTEVFYSRSRDGNYDLQINGENHKAKVEYVSEDELDLTLNGRKVFAAIIVMTDGTCKVQINGKEYIMRRNDFLVESSELTENESTNHSSAANHLLSPIPGKIFKINVHEGDSVKKGDVVIVVDAMKMENNLVAKRDSVVKKIHVSLNQMVTGNFLLAELEEIKN